MSAFCSSSSAWGGVRSREQFYDESFYVQKMTEKALGRMDGESGGRRDGANRVNAEQSQLVENHGEQTLSFFKSQNRKKQQGGGVLTAAPTP